MTQLLTCDDKFRNEKASCIREYVKAGFSLFRCGRRDPETGILDHRLPKFKGWKDTKFTSKPDLPDRCFGVSLKPDDLVLDIDPRRYSDTDQRKELWKLLNLPSLKDLGAFTVKSGGGGFHIYLKKPVDLKVRPKLDKLGFGAIECKTYGFYVVGAGSWHPSGTPYKFFSGRPSIHIEAPQALLEFVKRPYDKSSALDAEDEVIEDDATIERYIKYLKQAPPAVSGEGGQSQTFECACTGKTLGLSKKTTYKLLNEYYNPRCSPPWKWTELGSITDNAYKYSQDKAGSLNPSNDFVLSEYGEIPDLEAKNDYESLLDFTRWDFKPGTHVLKPNENNVIVYLNIEKIGENIDKPPVPNPLQKLVRKNNFTGKIEFTKTAPWKGKTDKHWLRSDSLELSFFLANVCHFNAEPNVVKNAITIVANRNSYHPVQDYLKSIEWDGVPRLDTWLSTYCGATNNIYTRTVGKCVLIGACARVFIPGCQYDHMMVLEGKQGTFKTSAVRVLGGPWYADIKINPDPTSADTPHKLRGTWIAECSEMAFLSRKRIEDIKSFLTIPVDYVRLPYAEEPEHIPRQSIFIGTINPSATGEYLQDPTGNRRYWPISTNTIAIANLQNDRDQLFAEAFERFKKGELWHLDDSKTIQMASLEQLKRVEKDLWQDIIEEYLYHNKLPDVAPTALIAREILSQTDGELDRTVKNRVSMIMTNLGYTIDKKWSSDAKRHIYGWFKHDPTEDM